MEELPNPPSNTNIKPYISGLCKHGIIRLKDNEKTTIKMINEFFYGKDLKDSMFDVSADKKRPSWLHVKFKDSSLGKDFLGEISLENGETVVLERWIPKPKPEVLDNYLNRLFNNNFKNDEHMQALAIKHRGWIPLKSSGDLQGLLDFKWIKNNRINAFDIRESMNNIRGGRVHKRYRGLVNTTTVWNWYINNNRDENMEE